MDEKLKQKLELAVIEHEEFKTKFPDVYAKTINGAGPAKYGHFIRDSWFYGFSATNGANVHDYLYSIFSEKDVKPVFSRKDADDIFLELMKNDLKTHSLFSRVLNTPIIYSFWGSVRLFGWLFWKK